MIKKLTLGLVLTAAMISSCQQHEDKAIGGDFLSGAVSGAIPASTAKVLRDKIKHREHDANFYLGFALSKVVSTAILINLYETTNNETAALAAIASFSECGLLAAASSFYSFRNRKAIKRNLVKFVDNTFKCRP